MFSFLPYNKFFIDQTCSAKMAAYWPHSFLRFIDLDKELGQYTASAILTSRLVNIKLNYVLQTDFCFLSLVMKQVDCLKSDVLWSL